MSLLWDIVQVAFSFLVLGVLVKVGKLLELSAPWREKRKQDRNEVLMQYRETKKAKKKGKE
jgi:hypothetical protein